MSGIIDVLLAREQCRACAFLATKCRETAPPEDCPHYVHWEERIDE